MLTLLTGPFPIEGGLRLDFLITMFYRNSLSNANSVDPDQTPRSAVCQCPFYGTLNINGLS